MQTARNAFLWWLEGQSGLSLDQLSVLVLRATPDPLLRKFKIDSLTCVQPWKPAFDALQGQGFSVHGEFPAPSSAKYDLVVILCTKHKLENQFLLALASTLVAETGTVVAALSNELGGANFYKELGRLMPGTESASKFKARVFWAKNSKEINRELQSQWLKQGEFQIVEGTTLSSRPGVFGWNKIDVGSALLAETISGKLSGSGADLGLGYGFLSDAMLKTCPEITELWGYEAEGTALEAARKNLGSDKRMHFEWADVTKGLSDKKFDFIVMNPPFHEGREMRVDLGEQFIRTAAMGLRPGGDLWLVANNQIPYEHVLREKFGEFERVVARDGFKILKAKFR